MKNNVCYGTPEWSQFLSKLHANSPELTEINLYHSSLPSIAVKELCEALCVNKTLLKFTLIRLQLDENSMLSILREVSQHPTLCQLNIWNNLISINSIRAIASLLRTNNIIETITLDNNYIKDEGAEIIAVALQNNNSLKHLVLNQNQISNKGIIALAKALQQNTRAVALKILPQYKLEGGIAPSRLFTQCFNPNLFK